MLGTVRTLLLIALCATACGLSQPAPPTATTEVPVRWQFLGAPTVAQLIDASDASFIAKLDGDVPSILAVAVRGAESEGWTETRRKEVYNGHTVYLESSDGQIMDITVVPEGTTTSLSVIIIPQAHP